MVYLIRALNEYSVKTMPNTHYICTYKCKYHLCKYLYKIYIFVYFILVFFFFFFYSLRKLIYGQK